MKRLPVIVTFVLVISSGLVHALWKESGGTSAVLEEAVGRVKLVPRTIGAWRGEDIALEAEEEFVKAGAEAYWMRKYVRRGKSITVLLMCGRAGRMSVHTPEFCYQGLGYQVVDAAANVEVATEAGKLKGEFWTARFTKQLGGAGDLRLFWGWNAGAGWRAPASPRWEFRGKPFLYKLYVVHETSPGQRLENEPALDFLKLALPELEKILFQNPTVVTTRNEVQK